MNVLVSKGLRTAVGRGGLLPAAAAAWSVPRQLTGTTPAVALAAHARRANSNSALPTVAQPSFWKSLIPKPLRKGSSEGASAVPGQPSKPKLFNFGSKEWNPATFFILIFLFIGSMSINMITLKRDYGNYMRQTEAKIGLLREVVERIQKGETVDVERILGTGDPEKEAEWEAVLKELGRDELPAKKQDKKPAPAAPTQQAAVPETPTAPEPASKIKVTSFY